MISVTALLSYLYCPRKLYLEKIVGYVEIPKNIVVKGAVKHRVFDELVGVEESIVSSVSADFDWNMLLEHYLENFSQILRRAVLRSAKQIRMAQLNPVSVFNEFLPFFNKEAEIRARCVFDFIQKHRVYGAELWNSLFPKIKSEYRVSSVFLGLSGKIDRVEVHKDRLVPLEIKSGSPPREGAWEGHKIQLAAYALLLEDKFDIKINEGVVYYADADKTVSIMINPFLKDQVKNLITNVLALLKSPEIPPLVGNENKCSVCGLRERCHSLVTEQKQNI